VRWLELKGLGLKHFWTAALVAMAVLAAQARAAEVQRDLVRIDSGQLKGVAQADVVAFKGIPYAAPPVGDLRWRPPHPVTPWSGVRAAEQYGAICPQKYDSKDNGVGPPPTSEDCLTLNIWTPVERAGRPVPVMVWVHGGGYVNGSGTAALYDGAHLARRGLVVVTLNYRLGRLGFFAHPALTRTARRELVANYGLMDQIAALIWVRSNIAAFGGDSGNVTLFGESAGGAAVNHLMIAPAAGGLFQRAIVESGAGGEHNSRLHDTNPDGLPSAEAQGVAFMEKLGVTTDDPAALRAIPADRIIAAGDPDASFGGGPIIDGKLLTMDVGEAFEKSAEARVPYLAGSNGLEIPFAVPSFDAILAGIAKARPDVVTRVKAAYGDEATFKLRAVSDLVFTAPARRLAALHARNGEKAFLYRFSFLSASMRGVLKGAPHASERQYVFETLNASTWPTAEADKPVAAAMSAYWADFARRGDPNGGGRPLWPAYSAAKDQLLDFTGDGPVASKVPLSAVLDAISGGGND
jgi:para-nitrobenzyl esterase